MARTPGPAGSRSQHAQHAERQAMTGPTINTHTEPGILHAARGASDAITTHADSAICRHRRLGVRPPGALGALARSTRCQRPAMPLGSAQLPWSGRCAASRLACVGAAAAHPQRRQVAPRRAVSAPCHRAGAPGAPMLRHRRSPPTGKTAARRKQSWPDPLRRRQESPAKRHHATAPVQGSKEWGKERSSWSGHSRSVLAYASASHASDSALVPGPDHSRQTGTSCRCATVFCCCTRLLNGGLRISNLPV